MPEGMASGPFVKTSLFRRPGDRFLNDGFMDMAQAFYQSQARDESEFLSHQNTFPH